MFALISINLPFRLLNKAKDMHETANAYEAIYRHNQACVWFISTIFRWLCSKKIISIFSNFFNFVVNFTL